MTKCIVYGLYSSRDGELRYIGQTVQAMKARIAQYRSHSRSNKTPIHRWFRRELDDGFEPMCKVVVQDGVYNVTEIDVIAKFRTEGARLLNVAAGGKGVLGGQSTLGMKFPATSERMRGNTYAMGSKWSESRKLYMRGLMRVRVFSEEHRRKISEAKRGHSVSAETRAKISDAVKAGISDEVRARMSESRKGRRVSDAVKAMASARMIGRKWSEEEVRKRVASRQANRNAREQASV